MAEYSIEDLKPTGSNEYRQVGTGIYFQNRNGRKVEKTVGVEYVPTKFGRIEQSKWFRLMEAAVEKENRQELLKQIEEACKRLVWLKTSKDRHEHALKVLNSGAYLHWPEWNGKSFFHFRFAEENDDGRGNETVQGKTAEVQETDCERHEP